MTYISESGKTGRRFRPSPRLIAAAVATVLVVVFAFQNTERNSIDFLWLSVETGLWLALLVTFVLGVVVGWLLQRFVLDKG